MKKKALGLLAAFFIVVVSITIVVSNRSSEGYYPPGEMCAEALANLSGEELQELFAPYNAIIDMLNAQYSTGSWAFSAYCPIDDRAFMISTLSEVSLAEFERMSRESVASYLTLDSWNLVVDAAMEAVANHEMDLVAEMQLRNMMNHYPGLACQIAGYLEDGHDIRTALEMADV